jgi:transcription factor IIIB subunit 2
VDDEEIEAMILTPEEAQLKTVIWYNANKEYLEEMAAKARKIEMDKKNGVYTKRYVSVQKNKK